jgi:hypothetical protein
VTARSPIQIPDAVFPAVFDGFHTREPIGWETEAAIFSEIPSESKERCMHFQPVGDAGM